MSEDGSPTGGQQQQPSQEFDQNSSLIEKVRSRVTSIIPQSFSKWFSPTTTGEDGSRNGGVRRRRDELLDDEDSYRDVDDSEEDEEADVVVRAPPTKRSKLNILEVQTPSESFQISHANTTNSFLSSTPTIISRRKHMGLKSIHQKSNNITAVPQSSAVVSRSISEMRSLTNYDAPDSDVLEVIPEHRGVAYEFGSHTSSRRSLNIPVTKNVLRDLRRPSLKTIRGNEASTSFHAASFLQNDDDEDNQDDLNAERPGTVVKSDYEKILTNGVRSSPNIITLDTASESGESQSSSIQKTKVSTLFGAGAKRLRTSAGSGLNYATHLQGKKSLFCDKNMPSHLNNSTTSLTSLNRRQSFNASLYGSTSALSDSRLLNTFSPFYKGCTTYGGASAYSKYSQNVQRTIRTPTHIRPASSLSTLSSSTASLAPVAETPSALSNTAKRILELMNQFTTPLGDIKKMANNTKVPALTAHRQRFSDLDRTANRGIRMSMPKTPYNRPVASTFNDPKQQLVPPINELQVPSMSQLLQLKKLQNNTERVREITNQSKSILNREQEYKLPTDNQSVDKTSTKHVNKIKNKLSSTRSSAKSGLGSSDETVEPVSLPDIPLPLLESVPKIDIAISKPSLIMQSSKKSSTTTLASNQQVSLAKASTSSTASISSTFTFNSSINSNMKSPQSNSVAAANSLQTETNSISTGGSFKFSSPIVVASSLSKNNVAPNSHFKFSDPFPVKHSMADSTLSGTFKYQLNDNNKLKSIETTSTPASALTTGVPVATQLKTGSVLDVLNKTKPIEKAAPISGAFGGQFKMTSDKWECSMCMVRNDNSVDKCVACETARKKPETTGVKLPTENQPMLGMINTFGDKFKPSSNTWECSTCMIRNKSDIVECVACNTAKPGAIKPATAAVAAAPLTSFTVPKTTDAGFKSLVAQQSAKWECSACMTRNESSRNKCVCCEQMKPGAVSDSVPNFSFGTTASKFTFGFAPGKSVEELKKSDATGAVPTSKETVGFTFGSKPVAVSTDSTSSGTKTFSFGLKPAATMPAPSTATVLASKDEPDKPKAATFSFGVPAQDKKPEPVKISPFGKTLDVDKKPAETAGFKFGSSMMASPSAVKTAGDSKETSASSSIFKPIGGLAFASSDKKSEEPVKPVFGSPASSNSSTEQNKPASTAGGFSLTNSSLSQKVENLPLDGSKKLFTFETPAAIVAEKKPEEKSSGFSFGSSSTSSAFKSPLAQKPVTGLGVVAAVKPEQAAAPPTFLFGKSSTPASATPTFGAISSNAITSSSSSNAVSTAPSFGGLSSSVTSSTASSFKSTPNITPATTIPSFGGSGLGAVATSPPQQNLKFGSSFSDPNSSIVDNKTASNLYSFVGGVNKTEIVTSMFGNVSSTTAAPGNKLFAFGAANASTTTAATTTASTTPFLFGAASTQKPNETATISMFGSAPNPIQNTNTTSLPAFGSFSATPQQQQRQPSHTPAFGQSSAISNPFGSANLNNSTPTFGSATASPVAPMFGSTAPSVPAFGSTGSAFGATNNTTFGSSATKTTFGNGFGSSASQPTDDPAAKKPAPGFNFGAVPQNTTTSFSFGSNNNNNNNDNKQPFAFSASTTPAFNFTGSTETATNAPFQFSAAQAANNMFAIPPGAPQTAQPLRRKQRTATRRTQQR